jgi:uncharacterized membrane protein
MPPTPLRWSDPQVETIIGNLLRAGVLLAAAVTLAGGVIYLAHHGGGAWPGYAVFRGQYSPLRQPLDIIQQALAGDGRAIIQLGVLLLMATPVARVAFSVAAFGLERDWTYVGTTLLVLAILLYSLVGGLR